MTEPTVEVTVTLPVELVRRALDQIIGDGDDAAYFREQAHRLHDGYPASAVSCRFTAALIETPLPEPVREVVVGCVARHHHQGDEVTVLAFDADVAWVQYPNAYHGTVLTADLSFVRDGSTE